MREAEAIALRNRLIGAGAVCLLVFVVSLFIPEPAERGQDEGVVIELGARPSTPLDDADGTATTATESDPPPSAPVRSAATAAEEDAPPAGEQASSEVSQPQVPAPAPKAAPPAEPSPPPAPSRESIADSEPTAEPAPPAGAGRWWIQAASYSDPEMAQAGRQRAEERGFDTRLMEVRVNGKPWWRLQIGPFREATAAKAAVAEVEAAGFRGARAIERQ